MMDNIDIRLDSLPYFDSHLQDEELQQQVTKLIEDEMHSNPPRNYFEKTDLPKSLDLFNEESILKSEIDRIEKGQKLEGLDTKRYLLLEPEVKAKGKGAKAKLEEEWKKALNNSRSQLEHMELSLVNQELMQEYASNSWRYNLYSLGKMENNIKEALNELKKGTLELHRDRKAMQVELGQQIKKLENEWQKLVNTNLQLDLAISGLEAEIAYLNSITP